MNIWVVRFDLDLPNIFISDMAYIHRLTDEYMGRRVAITGPPVFVGYGDLETGCFLFLSSPRAS
jgi:hypothetical protein